MKIEMLKYSVRFRIVLPKVLPTPFFSRLMTYGFYKKKMIFDNVACLKKVVLNLHA